jgi:hypothetical protein
LQTSIREDLGVSDEYLSFERVMRELKIQEDELKKLVSAGELRAFRDADQMKFKQEDVEEFLTTKDEGGGDVIDLLDSDQDLEAKAEPKSAGDELTEELVFDDVELGEAVGMKTEPLSDDDLFEEEELPAAEPTDAELVIGEDEEEELLGEGEDDEGLPAPIKRTKAAAAYQEEQAENPALLGVMVITAIVLLLGVLVAIDIATSQPSPMVTWLVGIFKP